MPIPETERYQPRGMTEINSKKDTFISIIKSSA
jgi:hypothetical protein